MKAAKSLKAFTLKRLALIASAVTFLSSCAQVQSQQPQVKVDGSSTVFPITKAVAKEFQSTSSNKVQVTPGKDSGTFDYFTEAITGKVDASRSDYTASEDDEVLVRGVSQDPNALGYFGLAYYEENQGKLKAIAVNSGKGAVLPSQKTVERAEYKPLARPLFIYINADAAQKNPALRDFVEFYLNKAPEIVSSVGYVPLSEDGYHLIGVHFYRTKVGTVFDGKSEFNLTIGELLRKQATF